MPKRIPLDQRSAEEQAFIRSLVNPIPVDPFNPEPEPEEIELTEKDLEVVE